MESSDLRRILRDNFTKFSDGDYHSFWGKPCHATWWVHNIFDGFKVIVFDDDSVYQLNTEAETMGIELKTPRAFKRRFTSFTGGHLL
ncbi:MAG: hypothetical protein EHM34_02360 [Nitrosopumilales archaeon]|nr:MAG: hypothetical protein EHM34_02360 [Nitrosopumilales archaeon]